MVFPGLPGSELGGVRGGTYISLEIGEQILLGVEYFMFP